MISNNSETINLIDLIKKGELQTLRLCQRLLQKDEANEVLQNSLELFIENKKNIYKLNTGQEVRLRKIIDFGRLIII